MKIALDIMGGDHAPYSNILGAKLFLNDNKDLNTRIFFVGKQSLIEKEIKDRNLDLDYSRIDFVDTKDIITMHEPKPTHVFKNKPNSSIVKSIQLVKDNEADAIISAGNTAALLSSSLFILGKIQGIKRPALATHIPTIGKGFVLCDVGANTDIRPMHLLQFGIMASAYVKYTKNIKSPKTALLNIGSEKNKGNNVTLKAYELLNKNLNDFIGNIESRYILDGKADVVLCDGFTGNVIIKLIEGFISHTYNWLSSEKKIQKADGVIDSINRIFNNYNYEEHGGSPFLGVKGIVLKSHGASSEISIKNTLSSAKLFFDRNLLNKMENEISENINLFNDIDLVIDK